MELDEQLAEVALMNVEEIHMLAAVEVVKLVGPCATVHHAREELMAANVKQELIHNLDKAF